MTHTAPILLVHHAGWTTAFGRADAAARSRFGGPIVHRLSGAPFGPRPLHQIAFVDLADVPSVPSTPVAGLPLLYGLCFDGCDLDYRVTQDEVDLAFVTPDRSNDDWPYENYPLALPSVPLAPVERRQQSWQDFREWVPNLNERESSKVTLIVPPPSDLGFSLWGPAGDAEGVTLVFQYSPADARVRAFNVCG
jgi:hypothetical protein